MKLHRIVLSFEGCLLFEPLNVFEPSKQSKAVPALVCVVCVYVCLSVYIRVCGCGCLCVPGSMVFVLHKSANVSLPKILYALIRLRVCYMVQF